MMIIRSRHRRDNAAALRTRLSPGWCILESSTEDLVVFPGCHFHRELSPFDFNLEMSSIAALDETVFQYFLRVNCLRIKLNWNW
jgi:hypothetical protein